MRGVTRPRRAGLGCRALENAAHRRTWLQSHRNPFTCDGAFHTASFSIDKVEKGSKGRLKKGRAYIQFCVTQGEETLLLSKSGWVPVR